MKLKRTMCGIIGFLDRRGGHDRPIGGTLLAMLRALGCRGPDSAGVAILGPPKTDWVLNVALPGEGSVRKALREEMGKAFERDPDTRLEPLGSHGVRLVISARYHTLVRAEAGVLAAFPSAEVVSGGHRLEIFKQVGSPEHLEAEYRISERLGTHGIGHTRLSTESRVDLSHSQPFWAHGVPDLATVHNGHITNYHKLRRRYEQRGYRFYTENDSEVIGVYLCDRLAAGLALPDALRSSLDDFDGSFSYLAAWGEGLAYVRDRFGFKPLVVAETEDFVAIATEEVAIRQALGSGFEAREPAPGTMQVWSVDQEKAHAATNP
jgi:glutamate synthase domain-containing protein 1